MFTLLELILLILLTAQVCKEVGFGRSLFQRLSSLGHFKYLLDTQYRMHPSISLFPNSTFYAGQVYDAPNVKRNYMRCYLPLPMFGPYSFLNISDGREERDDGGTSWRNFAEVAVVLQILKNLHKGMPIFGDYVSFSKEFVVYCTSTFYLKVETSLWPNMSSLLVYKSFLYDFNYYDILFGLGQLILCLFILIERLLSHRTFQLYLINVLHVILCYSQHGLCWGRSRRSSVLV